jgi:hypothetical protein
MDKLALIPPHRVTDTATLDLALSSYSLSSHGPDSAGSFEDVVHAMTLPRNS